MKEVVVDVKKDTGNKFNYPGNGPTDTNQSPL